MEEIVTCSSYFVFFVVRKKSERPLSEVAFPSVKAGRILRYSPDCGKLPIIPEVKSFFRIVLRVLVLVVVALISAVTTMRFAIHGREVTVPDLVGRTPVEARRLVEARGLQLEVERQFYSATVPEGHILSQVPSENTQVRRGWQVRVAQSLGPQRVQIPSALGETERAAEMNIRRRGLDIGSVAEIALSNATPDQVVAQSPLPDARDVSDPKIGLLVATQPPPQAFVMPSFIGQPLATAKLVLQTAGLSMGAVTQGAPPAQPGSGNAPSGGAPAGAASVSAPAQPEHPPSAASIIVAQTPAPGQQVLVGSPVNFEVK